MARWRTWRAAMTEALYGENGFYRSPGTPSRHFRTAAAASPQWAGAIARLAGRVDRALGEPRGFTVVDIGAGAGELVAGIAAVAPARWRIVGVDVAARPAGVPARVEWSTAPPDGFSGVLVAVEWLDVVPVDVVEATAGGSRLVEVSDDGAERIGAAPDPVDAAWLERWWSPAEVGDRAEVGRPRDDAWAAAARLVHTGACLAVDYAAVPARDVAGTLTGYRAGRQVAPVPDGTCDITAHVLFESLVDAVDADDSRMLSQADALRELGVSGRRPGWSGDPTSYLEELGAAGEAAELLDPDGLGGFTWLIHAKGVTPPL